MPFGTNRGAAQVLVPPWSWGAASNSVGTYWIGAMVSKCFNPSCTRPFRYLADGKLFHIDISQHPELRRKRPDPRRTEDIEHFWLCGHCAQLFTVDFVPGEGISAVPLHSRKAA